MLSGPQAILNTLNEMPFTRVKLHFHQKYTSVDLNNPQLCYNSPKWPIRQPTPLGLCEQLHFEASNIFSRPHWGGFSVTPDLGKSPIINQYKYIDKILI